MNTAFIVNWIAAAVGIFHVFCTLVRIDRLGIAEWRALLPQRFAVEAAWRIGYAALGAGCAGILLGPVYGYSHPPAWEVVVNVGWVTALIANYFRKGA